MEIGDKVICKKLFRGPVNKRVKFFVGNQYEISYVTKVVSNNMAIYIIRCEDYGGMTFYSDEYFEGFPMSVPSLLTTSGRMVITEYPGKKFSDYFDFDIKSMRRLKLDKIDKVSRRAL